ncbi:MAG: lamin tail domain-containing protein [Candidatus Sumerlaeia bacterium]|nr:lamin tail domain-containing protein [Candidatus Sumerlaeia bacterium]
MKNLFAPLAALAVAALASNAQAQIIINEVWNGASTDEWIEFHNNTASAVNVNGWTLVRRTNAATSDATIFTFPNVSIPAGGFYTIADSGANYFTASASYTNIISTGNQSIAIKNVGGTVIDGLSVGTGSLGVGTLFYAEGTTFPSGISSGTGIRRISNQDTNNNSADFEATNSTTRTPGVTNGVPPAPEADVTFASLPVADAPTTVSLGTFTQGTGTQTATFTVTNSGTAALTTSNLVISGAGFSAGADALLASIAAAANDTFTVSIDTTNSGTLNGSVSFNNNDADENPYNFPITASILPAATPEIEVSFGASPVTDGATGLNFGSFATGAGNETLTFTVNNAGTGLLSGLSANVTGGVIGSNDLATSIGAGLSDTFTVDVPRSFAGTFPVTVSIASNDADENPFNFEGNISFAVPTNTPTLTAFSTSDAVVRVTFGTAPLNGGELIASNYTIGANVGSSVFLQSGTTYDVFFTAQTGDLTLDTLTFNNGLDTAASDTFFSGIVPLSTIRAAVLADVDATPFAPTLGAAGETVTVQGIVTNTSIDIDEIRIQQGTAGITLFDGVNNTYGFPFTLPALGDEIRVAGNFSTFNGLTQIIPGTFSTLPTVSTANALPAPQVVNTASAVAADYEAAESTLVTYTNVSFITSGGAWGTSSANFPINATTTGLALVRQDIDAATIPGNVPAGLGSVSGMLVQFDTADPRDASYQVIPLSPSDVSFSSSESDWMILNN